MMMLTKTLSRVFVSTDTSKDWILVEMVPTFAVPMFEKRVKKGKWLLRMVSLISLKRSLRRESLRCVLRARGDESVFRGN